MAAGARSRRVETPRPTPATGAPRRAGAPRARGAFAGGVVWIVAIAALLAGVVALNVAVLRLNVELDELAPRARRAAGRERDARAAALERVGERAGSRRRRATKLGLVRGRPRRDDLRPPRAPRR